MVILRKTTRNMLSFFLRNNLKFSLEKKFSFYERPCLLICHLDLFSYIALCLFEDRFYYVEQAYFRLGFLALVSQMVKTITRTKGSRSLPKESTSKTYQQCFP